MLYRSLKRLDFIQDILNLDILEYLVEIRFDFNNCPNISPQALEICKELFGRKIKSSGDCRSLMLSKILPKKKENDSRYKHFQPS